ncbi:hypothetical protein [Chryseobacterium indoltheticum]|uniref:hypothetical protein n=1 Tax=Chryseobacterium indoltheticum TaxID=254 RepID=UPI003F4965E7
MPANFSAKENSTTKTEFSNTKPKRKQKSNKKRTTTASTNKDCTYNGRTLYVGKEAVAIIIQEIVNNT